MTAEILVIALTLLGEARGEGIEGMAGVASVIQTRAIERKQTPTQVCLAPKQFSFWNGGVSEAQKRKLLAILKRRTLCILRNLLQKKECPMLWMVRITITLSKYRLSGQRVSG